jgi:hypothetical protein
MPWWQGPTYHCGRDPLITVAGTHLSLLQGPTYHCGRDPLITVAGTHLSLLQTLITVAGTYLSLLQGPTYHCCRDPLITVAGTYHCCRDPLITVAGTHLSRKVKNIQELKVTIYANTRRDDKFGDVATDTSRSLRRVMLCVCILHIASYDSWRDLTCLLESNSAYLTLHCIERLRAGCTLFRSRCVTRNQFRYLSYFAEIHEHHINPMQRNSSHVVLFEM